MHLFTRSQSDPVFRLVGLKAGPAHYVQQGSVISAGSYGCKAVHRSCSFWVVELHTRIIGSFSTPGCWPHHQHTEHDGLRSCCVRLDLREINLGSCACQALLRGFQLLLGAVVQRRGGSGQRPSARRTQCCCNRFRPTRSAPSSMSPRPSDLKRAPAYIS